MKTVKWIDIPGYEKLYQITDAGQIRSLPRNTTKGKVLKNTINNKGYPCVNLCKNGTATKIAVHQLILLSFVGPMPRGEISRHLDGDPTNSTLTNLKYGTHSQNNNDAVKHGTFRDIKGSKHHLAKLTEIKVLQIREQYASGLFSQEQLAEHFEISQQTVSDITRKKLWRHI